MNYALGAVTRLSGEMNGKAVLVAVNFSSQWSKLALSQDKADRCVRRQKKA